MTSLIYQQVTDTIIKQLESGAAPWVKQWQGSSSGSHNVISGKGYNGINTIILGMSEAAAGYKSGACNGGKDTKKASPSIIVHGTLKGRFIPLQSI